MEISRNGKLKKEQILTVNNSSTVIIGNLTRDPEFDTLPSGATKATFSVASERRWMQNNEWQSETSFFNVIAWRNEAEMARDLLEKGMQVIVVGALKQRSYVDKDGNNRSAVEVTADKIGIGLWALQSVTRRQSTGAGQQTRSAAPAPSEAPF